MAASDAIPVPRKNIAYRFYFAIRKPSDSTLITTWAGMDSEVSLDGAAFADCTNEATEIGTSGCGYIDLTAAEMNADSVILKVTVTNTGAVPLVFTFLPETAGDYRCDTVMISGDSAAADNLESACDNYSATRGLAGTALPAAAADAAGGLPISDAGGLDLDGKLANTNEITAARMGALTDWINGGRLDLILDIIAADTTTDIPALLSSLIASLQVNTRANIQVPVEIETPDAGTAIWKIRLFLFDEEGNMEAPDSTPTIALVNAAGTDRSSRLSVASNPSTGVYSWDYTATDNDDEEQLVWTFAVVEGTLTRVYPATSYVVEETAYRFSSTDRATLNATATQASVNTIDGIVDAILVDTDATIPALVAAEAVKTSAIQSSLTTILSRLGAWTGSGLNTILGAFRALAAKAAALTPTDLSDGTTFVNTTDALEALRDRGDAAWTTGGGGGGGGDATVTNQNIIIAHLTDIKGGGWDSVTDSLEEIRDAIDASSSPLAGPGADEVTITVTDDGIAEENVSVWISSDSSGSTVIAGTLTTNGAGQRTFLLTAGVTYYLWAHKAGKIDIQGQSFVAVAD